jgi:hypothetical protein
MKNKAKNQKTEVGSQKSEVRFPSSIFCRPKSRRSALRRRMASVFVVALCIGGCLLAPSAFAQQLSIGWAKIAAGSSTSSGGAYSVSGTIGQAVAAVAVNGGNYTLENGYWGIIAGVQSSGVPFLAIIAAGHLLGSDSQLEFNGDLGQTYMLQASTNLKVWETVLTFTCTNSPMVVVDPDAGSYPRRFYRITQ